MCTVAMKKELILLFPAHPPPRLVVAQCILFVKVALTVKKVVDPWTQDTADYHSCRVWEVSQLIPSLLNTINPWRGLEG